MKIEKKSDNSIYLVLLAMLFIGIYAVYSMLIVNPKNDKIYLADYAIVNGWMKSLHIQYINNIKPPIIGYTYESTDHEIRVTNDIPCKSSDVDNPIDREILLSLNFPVAVSKKNPTYAIPLLRPKDFERINLPFPDSLKQNYERYFKCTWWESFWMDD